MEESDLHIGPVYTDPNFRGKGITKFVLNSILQKYGTKRSYWWVTSNLNSVSQIVAERLGFTLVGYGRKERKFLINRYVIKNLLKA